MTCIHCAMFELTEARRVPPWAGLFGQSSLTARSSAWDCRGEAVARRIRRQTRKRSLSIAEDTVPGISKL